MGTKRRSSPESDVIDHRLSRNRHKPHPAMLNANSNAPGSGICVMLCAWVGGEVRHCWCVLLGGEVKTWTAVVGAADSLSSATATLG